MSVEPEHMWTVKYCKLHTRVGRQVLLLAAGLVAGIASGAGEVESQARLGREVRQTLVVRYATNRICRVKEQGACKEWDEVKLRSYNGGLVGPTIEARPGDTLYITLENRLPPEPAAFMHDVNIPHGFNSTNLHTHGLHVSPEGNSDNVMLSIAPGHRFEYEIKVPSDHPAGTYWYHAHKHGSVAIQLASGMAGPLIIRGNIDELAKIKATKEQIFLFQQIPYREFDDYTLPPPQPSPLPKRNMVESYEVFGQGAWLKSGRRTTVNGEVEPTLKLRPGEVQRWRFIHGGIRETIKVKLVAEGDTGTAIPHYQIAHDGITTGRRDESTETELQPGYRTDVLVKFAQPGTYLMLDEASGALQSLMTLAEPRKVLARVLVEGPPKNMELPSEQELAPLAPFQPIADSELTGAQGVRFNFDFRPNPDQFTVNGKSFDPSAAPRRLVLGAVEEWLVSSQNQGHPFHIHVNPFQVTDSQGRILWKDTLFVPQGESRRLRTRYRRYIGTFVLHCHILDHEDQGMMELVQIVPPGMVGSGHSHGAPPQAQPAPTSHGGHH
jgi:FtsP/CotA-like multicopper oxidase with cupredoxin domain